MKITKIEQQKKNLQRYSIYIDGEFAFGLHEEVVVQYGLKNGLELSDDQIARMQHDDEYQVAWQKALRLLTRSKKSEKDVRAKLADFEQPIVDRVIAQLTDYHLVDDEDYARMLAADALNLSGRSPRAIRQKLFEKGIAKDTIDQIIDEIDDKKVEQNILELIEKRKSQGKTKDQIVRFLAGRGYGWDDISTVLAKVEGL